MMMSFGNCDKMKEIMMKRKIANDVCIIAGAPNHRNKTKIYKKIYKTEHNKM